jgi:hypothetical protein
MLLVPWLSILRKNNLLLFLIVVLALEDALLVLVVPREDIVDLVRANVEPDVKVHMDNVFHQVLDHHLLLNLLHLLWLLLPCYLLIT